MTLELQGDGIVDIIKEMQREEGFNLNLSCNKCDSENIIIIGEDGRDYGELTGYCEGTNVIKCKDCGNAVTVWK